MRHVRKKSWTRIGLTTARPDTFPMRGDYDDLARTISILVAGDTGRNTSVGHPGGQRAVSLTTTGLWSESRKPS